MLADQLYDISDVILLTSLFLEQFLGYRLNCWTKGNQKTYDTGNYDQVMVVFAKLPTSILIGRVIFTEEQMVFRWNFSYSRFS